MPETVRSLIQARQAEVRQSELDPYRASQILVELSSLMGNIAEEIRETELAFNQVLLGYYESEKTANRAKIKAEITPEYQRMREAKDAQKLAKELIGTIKYYLRVREDDLRYSGHQ